MVFSQCAQVIAYCNIGQSISYFDYYVTLSDAFSYMTSRVAMLITHANFFFKLFDVLSISSNAKKGLIPFNYPWIIFGENFWFFFDFTNKYKICTTNDLFEFSIYYGIDEVMFSEHCSASELKYT